MKTLAKRLCILACIIFALGLLAVTLVGFLPHRGYLIDQCSQLRLLYLVASVPLMGAVLFFRSPILAAVTCVSLLVNGVVCMPLVAVPSHQATEEPRLKIVAANIWGAHNYQYDRLVSFVKEERPDVLCLEEVNSRWVAELKSRLSDYPFSASEGVSGGAAIFSKVPFSPTRLGSRLRRYGVRGAVQWQGKQLLLIAEHPPSPYTRSNWVKRNREFARLSDDLQSRSLPVVIAGDLNSSPWSWYFQQMVQKGRLIDSENGHGLQPTWSTHMPLALVPIDHCLHTDELATDRRTVGPNIGSDHLPLIVELSWRDKPNHRI